MSTKTTDTVTICGSHGELTAHRATGIIISRPEDYCCEDCNGPGYNNIARFDPVSLQHYDAFDILGTAYWTHDGIYEPALTVRSIVDAEGEYLDFDDWVPFALLEAA